MTRVVPRVPPGPGWLSRDQCAARIAPGVHVNIGVTLPVGGTQTVKTPKHPQGLNIVNNMDFSSDLVHFLAQVERARAKLGGLASPQPSQLNTLLYTPACDPCSNPHAVRTEPNLKMTRLVACRCRKSRAWRLHGPCFDHAALNDVDDGR